MSRITVIRCDRCGGEVDPVRIGYISMMQRDEKTGDLKGKNPFEDMDICGKCMDMIAGFITQEPAKRVPKGTKGGARRKAPAAVKKPERKEKLDVGKIGALAAAGWDPHKIADEMQISVETVESTLKEIVVIST